jgi:hypothetical protein
MTTINMKVGQSYTYDLSATVPAIPAGVSASVTSANPSLASVTPDASGIKGSVQALAPSPSTGVVVTYAVPGYISTTDVLSITAAPLTPVVVTRGTVG